MQIITTGFLVLFNATFVCFFGWLIWIVSVSLSSEQLLFSSMPVFTGAANLHRSLFLFRNVLKLVISLSYSSGNFSQFLFLSSSSISISWGAVPLMRTKPIHSIYLEKPFCVTTGLEFGCIIQLSFVIASSFTWHCLGVTFVFRMFHFSDVFWPCRG